MNLLIVPVVLGQGTRLFPDLGPDIARDMVDSTSRFDGVTIQVYRPTGRPRSATATADHDDDGSLGAPPSAEPQTRRQVSRLRRAASAAGGE
jgi:hypothetical protein